MKAMFWLAYKYIYEVSKETISRLEYGIKQKSYIWPPVTPVHSIEQYC